MIFKPAGSLFKPKFKPAGSLNLKNNTNNADLCRYGLDTISNLVCIPDQRYGTTDIHSHSDVYTPGL